MEGFASMESKAARSGAAAFAPKHQALIDLLQNPS
jgi:hypothetical protein